MRGPFLMPDGRSLAAVLAAEARDPAGGDAVVRRGRLPRASHGAHALEKRWKKQQQPATAAAAGAKPAGAGGDPSTSAPALLAADVDLSRLGRAKARRALNDRILRALAGPLTLSSISGLFSPAPFGGGGPPSALSRVLPGGEGADVWEAFRAVDLDRQARALAAWEGHLAAGRAAAAADAQQHRAARPPADAAAAAAASATAGLRAWAGISHRAREALKRAGPSRVDTLEAPVLLWLATARSLGAQAGAALAAAGPGAPAAPPPLPLRLPTADAWTRALVHGLAQFHRLRLKQGRAAGSGGDVAELHLPVEVEGHGGGVAARPQPMPPSASFLTSEDEDAGGLSSSCPPTPRSVISPSAVPPASCGDVLAAFAAARAAGGGDLPTPSACLREFLLEHAGAAPGAA